MNMDKSAVFYMLPTRAWELLIGSLLAIVTLPRIQNIAVLNVIAALGLLLMVYSIFGFTRETPFPSGYAAIYAWCWMTVLRYTAMIITSRPSAPNMCR